jgi:hypothetical protein
MRIRNQKKIMSAHDAIKIASLYERCIMHIEVFSQIRESSTLGIELPAYSAALSIRSIPLLPRCNP